jgi:hypothetical protein
MLRAISSLNLDRSTTSCPPQAWMLLLRGVTLIICFTEKVKWKEIEEIETRQEV